MKKEIDWSYGIIIHRLIDGVLYYLLVKQIKNETWSFPKGHPENDETPRQAAIREAWQEAGLQFYAQDLTEPKWPIIREYSMFSKEKRRQVSRGQRLFIAQWSGIKPIINMPDEIEELGWFSLAQVQEKKHQGFEFLVENIQEAEEFIREQDGT